MLRYRGLPGGRGYPRATLAVSGFSAVLGQPGLFQPVLVELQGRHVVRVDVGTRLSGHGPG